MVKPDKRMLLFIRALKEIGLHLAFLESRVCCLYDKSYPTHSYTTTIHDFIDVSLTWRMTPYEKLWSKLHDELSNYWENKFTSKESERKVIKALLEDSKEMEKVKEIIRNNT